MKVYKFIETEKTSLMMSSCFN